MTYSNYFCKWKLKKEMNVYMKMNCIYEEINKKYMLTPDTFNLRAQSCK